MEVPPSHEERRGCSGDGDGRGQFPVAVAGFRRGPHVADPAFVAHPTRVRKLFSHTHSIPFGKGRYSHWYADSRRRRLVAEGFFGFTRHQPFGALESHN